MRFEPGLLSKAIVAATFAVAFAGCGGGGSHHHDDPATVDDEHEESATHVLSGTAAGGAPVIGQVTLKDALGTLRTVSIEANGNYSVDVSGLTAPFLLRAVGTVGGRNVYYVSAATEADLDGTINITPFTDLIVANVAGQVASAYFDSPDFAKLTAAELNSAKTTLTQRLLPILASVGLESTIDLLRTSFAADHSGLDAALDAIRVTVDSVTGVALIKDLVNGTSIVDNLADPHDATVIATPAVSLATGLSDIAAIQAQLTAFTDLFATAMPDPDDAALRAFFADEGFLESGHDLEGFLDDLTIDDNVVGLTFSDISIVKRSNEGAVRVAITNSVGGHTETFEWDMEKIGGVWKIAGNHLPIDNEARAVNARNLSDVFGNLSTGSDYRRYLELWVDYAPENVNYVHVTGPGINGEVVLKRDTLWQGFVVTQTDGETVPEHAGSWLAECDQQAQSMPCIEFPTAINQQYTFSVRDENDEPLSGVADFTRTLTAPPVSNVQAAANAAKWFATIASVTPANYNDLTDGTTITIGLTMPTDSHYVFDYLTYGVADETLDAMGLASNGASVELTWSGSAPVVTDDVSTRPFINVATVGENDRRFVTLGRHNPLP